MEITLLPVVESDQAILGQLLQLYAYDFSAFTHEDVNAEGLYEYPYLDLYWTEPNRHAFFIQVGGHYTGFVLVRTDIAGMDGITTNSMAEFFVLRKYRRQGIGRLAAHHIFDQFKGRWEVTHHLNNQPALAFWEPVIAAYTSGHYRTQEMLSDGQTQRIICF